MVPIANNPLFTEDNASTIAYEQRIADLERQLQYQKKRSEEIQTAMLMDSLPSPSVHATKRQYRTSDDTIRMRAFLKENVKNQDFVTDLIQGVGISTANPSNIPKSLLRAYVMYRYRINKNADRM